MSKIIQLFKDKGLTCFTTDRFNLDSFFFEPYQDEGQEFEPNKVFETENRAGKLIDIELLTNNSNFSYFLDGSRYTYKVADMFIVDIKYHSYVQKQEKIILEIKKTIFILIFCF